MRKPIEGVERFNRISGGANATLSTLFILLALLCIIPFVFVIMISLSSETSIAQNGYQFWPKELSFEAYGFLWKNINMLLDALKVSMIVTVVGTVIGLILTTAMGYVLSRDDFKLNALYTWIVFIPMIFNGGLISTYFIN